MTLEEIKIFTFVSIISADNDSLDEDTKQDILHRRKEKPNDWEYILQPIEDEKVRKRYIDLLTYEETKEKSQPSES